MSSQNTRRVLGFLGLSVVLSLGATQAGAHANLVGAVPAKGATVASPALIVLHFSEPLEMKVATFKLAGADGRPVAVKASTPPDAKSLAAVPATPLTPGLYTVSWTSMGDDAHKLTGTFSFSVK